MLDGIVLGRAGGTGGVAVPLSASASASAWCGGFGSTLIVLLADLVGRAGMAGRIEAVLASASRLTTDRLGVGAWGCDEEGAVVGIRRGTIGAASLDPV